MNQRILIVDDEAHVGNALRRALMDEAYEVVTAQNGMEALQLMGEGAFQLIISDERMPGMQGSELLAIISLRWPETIRILLTGQASLDAAMRAVNEGEVYRFFLKPWNDVELRLAIRSGLDKYDLEVKNRKLLALVRIQEMRLRTLDDSRPNIVQTKDRNQDGSFHLPELTDSEISELLEECSLKPER
ncbi:MAG: response regulator [Trichloromonadaceae bacterium]